ncbi:MAG: hypothetical protein U0W40_07820 [Acidimicrobiia bacterium]
MSTVRCSSGSTAGATKLLGLGYPDIIIGDFDSVSQKGLHCGAELVHHVHPDDRRARPRRTCSSGASTTWSSWSTARAKTSRCCSPTSRAQLIVAVGTRATMVEFLDKEAPGMASVPHPAAPRSVLVGAGREPALRRRVRRLDIVLLVSAALIAMLVVAIVAEPIHVFARGLWVTLQDIFGG